MNSSKPLLLILILLLLPAGCTAPGKNDDYGPEIVLDNAVHAFIDGFNNRDLAQFDTYFAPASAANPDGLLHTQTMAHQLLDTAPPDATLKLDEWKITNDYSALKGNPVVSYQAKVSLWQDSNQLWTNTVTQDVSFEKMPDGLWKIVSADPPVINGNTYEPPPQTVNVPPSWTTETTGQYRLSYPPEVYHIYETDSAKSLITLEPIDSILQQSPDTMFYRITVAAIPNDTRAAVSGAYDPASLFGHGPILEYALQDASSKTIQEMTLDGSPAYRLDNPNGLDITADIVALRHDVLYEIVVEPFESGKANPDTYLPLVEQVIGTFQFTP